MGRFSPKDEFSPRPVFALGLFVHKLGAWLMGYRWGTDLYLEGMKCGKEGALWEAGLVTRAVESKEGQSDG